MAGERLESADIGWFGLDGDRRPAFRRVRERGGSPWLTASRMPELIRFAPMRPAGAEDALPTHVRTPDGRVLELFGDDLAAEVGSRLGASVETMHLARGIFDEASLPVIASSTVDEIARLAGQGPDVRRFRPNLLRTLRAVLLEEDDWVGGVLVFGDEPHAAAITVTNRDERCATVNFDPDSGRTTAVTLQVIVRERDNNVGVYGSVTRRGRHAVGQPVWFVPAAEAPGHG